MIDEETTGRWKRLGFKDPSAFYFLGRGGVLGDGVDASVVTAAMGWFEPGFMRSQWTEGAEVASPRRTARHYAQACAEWGEKHLADIDHIARLVSLAERVADSAEGSGLPLFSGWRAEPRPELLSSRLIHLFFVLREWRGGLHLNATTAMGLGPVEAILTNEGEGQARGFGWTGPFPDCSGLSMRHDEAEAITDQLTGVVYERALSPAERAEFAELVGSVGSRILG
jgi:hypothetical protein